MIQVVECQTAQQVIENARRTAERVRSHWRRDDYPAPVNPKKQDDLKAAVAAAESRIEYYKKYSSGLEDRIKQLEVTNRALYAKVSRAEILGFGSGLSESSIPVAVVKEFFIGRSMFSAADLVGERRTADVVLERQILAWLTKTVTVASLPIIGAMIGGRDHTTIIHSIRKIDALREGDQTFKARTDQLVADIRSMWEGRISEAQALESQGQMTLGIGGPQ